MYFSRPSSQPRSVQESRHIESLDRGQISKSFLGRALPSMGHPAQTHVYKTLDSRRMAHKYPDVLIHCVFSSKERRDLIPKESLPKLWKYFAGIGRNPGIPVPPADCAPARHPGCESDPNPESQFLALAA